MDAIDFLKIFLRYPSISTDTRKINKGDIFFALKGENFNGNLYVGDALANGASYAITDDKKKKGEKKTIVVDNVLSFLQSLARAYRDSLNCKVIAITGSNGKTTTKELCHTVLLSQYKTHATKGNFNNHIGVPLTILSAPTDVEVMIVEMGANHVGEINQLCNIADPDIGIITNIGKAHLEGFGGLKGVIKAKLELYNYLYKKGGIIIYNPLDNILKENIPNGYNKVVPYLSSKVLKVNPSIKMIVEDQNYISSLFGLYNVTNILCAITLGKYLGVTHQNMSDSISNYLAKNNRSEIRVYKGATIILDAYNANPTSMEASLQSFDKTEGKKKIVILGDMLELGKYSMEEHQRIFDLAKDFGFNKIILLGNEFLKVKGSDIVFKNVEDARSYFNSIITKDAVILIKGSRGINMERLLSED